jgi:hypothetical protein
MIECTGESAELCFDGIEQRCERRDLVRFRVHGDLGHHDPGGGVQSGQQMDLAAVAQTGAAQCLAVHRDHPAIPGR